MPVTLIKPRSNYGRVVCGTRHCRIMVPKMVARKRKRRRHHVVREALRIHPSAKCQGPGRVGDGHGKKSTTITRLSLSHFLRDCAKSLPVGVRQDLGEMWVSFHAMVVMCSMNVPPSLRGRETGQSVMIRPAKIEIICAISERRAKMNALARPQREGAFCLGIQVKTQSWADVISGPRNPGFGILP